MSNINLLVILGILSAVVVGLAILLVLVRFMFDLRLTAIQKETDHSQLFRRKLNHLRKIEQAKHIRYLLLTCLMIGIGVALTIGSFLALADDHQKLKTRTIKLEERVDNLETQQEQLVKSIPLKKYPEKGIGLTDYEWDKLIAGEKESKLQEQMETAISQQSAPYFGSFDTQVSVTEAKTLTLQLKSWTEDDTSGDTIKQNLDAFAKEAEKISELTAIHVRMITFVGNEKQVIYSVNYSREKSEDVFHKKNVSEQNLKNDGGKG